MRTGRASRPPSGGNSETNRELSRTSSKTGLVKTNSMKLSSPPTPRQLNTRPVLLSTPSPTTLNPPPPRQLNTRPVILSTTSPKALTPPTPKQLNTRPILFSTTSSTNLNVPASVTPFADSSVCMTECSSPSSSSESAPSGSFRGKGSNTKTVAEKVETPKQSKQMAPLIPDEQIKVAVRVRPLLGGEKESGEKRSWEWDNNSIHLIENDTNIFNYATKNVKQSYQFDHLFGTDSTNAYIFDSVVKNIVRSAMEGFHGSVFTYGQTSSGKTFTMNGDKNQPGIIPQAIAECFDAVNNMPGRDFILRVSYLEVYNEQIKDLLSMDVTPVRIQHDPKKGTVLTGVQEQVVLNTQQVLALIKSGEAHRHVGSTDMNEKSSRAHTLFKIIVESTSSCGKEPVRVSQLYLVDLAGSESAKMTNSKGERAREAKHINQSLLTLSTIIQRLSEDRQSSSGSASRKQHLPYRDSKLTRILEPALDGNAQIGIICTVSPTAKCVEETGNTLKFASRAKMIKMSAKVNETVDDKTLLRAYKEEIEQLRVRLQELEKQTFASKALTLETAVVPIVDHTDSSSTIETYRHGRNTEDDDEEDDDARLMIQMITEMERLILRADVSRNHTMPGLPRKSHSLNNNKYNNNNNPNNNSGILRSGSGSGEKNLGTARRSSEKKIISPARLERRKSKEAEVLSPDSADEIVPVIKPPRPKHPSFTSGTRKSEKVKVFNSSSAALLSMIMEATDSDNLMRIDTVEERDHESGTEPEGGSDSFDDLDNHNNSNNNHNDDKVNNKEEEEEAEEVHVANLTDDFMSVSGEERLGEVSFNLSYSEEGAKGATRSETKERESDKPSKLRDIPVAEKRKTHNVSGSVNGNDIDNDDNTNENDSHGKSKNMNQTRNEQEESNKSTTSTARKETDENIHHTELSEVTIPAPSPELEPFTENDKKSFLAPSDPPNSVATKPSAAMTGIPRLSGFKGKSALRSMSIDSEAGGDEHSVLSSHPGDYSWDEFDTAGGDSSARRGIPVPLPPPTAPPTAVTAVAIGTEGEDRATATSVGINQGKDTRGAGRGEQNPTSLVGRGFMEENNKNLEDWPMVEIVEDDSVLLGVSKMLTVLKGHLSKVQRRNPHNLSNGDLRLTDSPISSSSTTVAAGTPSSAIIASPNSASATNSPSRSALLNSKTRAFSSSINSNSHNSHNGNNNNNSGGAESSEGESGGLRLHEKFDYERLKLDFRLKEADNRFLQEELDNKNKMLAMLTEGLKEVEKSQTMWLTANQDLSYELEKALYQNKQLKAEIARLTGQQAVVPMALPMPSSSNSKGKSVVVVDPQEQMELAQQQQNSALGPKRVSSSDAAQLPSTPNPTPGPGPAPALTPTPTPDLTQNQTPSSAADVKATAEVGATEHCDET